MKQILLIGIIGIVILAGVILATSFSGGSEITLENQAAAKTAPSFTIQDLDGNTISLADNIANGKPTIVYFMASWCPTCAKNWNYLNEVYPEYKDSVSFISVSVDPTDTNEVLSKLSAEKGFVFPVSEGNPELARAYKVYVQTAKVAIDSSGNIIYEHDGSLSVEQWRDLFRQVK